MDTSSSEDEISELVEGNPSLDTEYEMSEYMKNCIELEKVKNSYHLTANIDRSQSPRCCWYRVKGLAKEVQDRVSVAEDKCAALRNNLEQLRSAMDMIHQQTFNNITTASSFLLTFIKILMENSKDSALLSDLMRIVPASSGIKCFLLTKMGAEMLEYVLYHSRKAKFNLWGILPFENCETDQQHLLQEYQIEDSEEVISTIIKYGGSVEKAGFRLYQKLIYRGEIEELSLPPFRINWKGKSRKEMLMNQIVYFAKMPQYKYGTSEKSKSIIQLIWRSISDPYPTRADLEAYLETTCKWKPPSFQTSVSEVCDLIGEAISKKAFECPQPRSLRHLSRCLIRKRLFESYHLPDGITSLKLPEAIKKYLRLEY